MSTHVTDLLALRHAGLLHWTRSYLEGVHVNDHVWGNDTPSSPHLRTHGQPPLVWISRLNLDSEHLATKISYTNRAPQAKVWFQRAEHKSSHVLPTQLKSHHSPSPFTKTFLTLRRKGGTQYCAQPSAFLPFPIHFPSASRRVFPESLLDLDKGLKVLRFLTSWLGIQAESVYGNLIMMAKCKSFSSVR